MMTMMFKNVFNVMIISQISGNMNFEGGYPLCGIQEITICFT